MLSMSMHENDWRVTSSQGGIDSKSERTPLFRSQSLADLASERRANRLLASNDVTRFWESDEPLRSSSRNLRGSTSVTSSRANSRNSRRPNSVERANFLVRTGSHLIVRDRADSSESDMTETDVLSIDENVGIEGILKIADWLLGYGQHAAHGLHNFLVTQREPTQLEKRRYRENQGIDKDPGLMLSLLAFLHTYVT